MLQQCISLSNVKAIPQITYINRFTCHSSFWSNGLRRGGSLIGSRKSLILVLKCESTFKSWFIQALKKQHISYENLTTDAYFQYTNFIFSRIWNHTQFIWNQLQLQSDATIFLQMANSCDYKVLQNCVKISCNKNPGTTATNARCGWSSLSATKKL